MRIKKKYVLLESLYIDQSDEFTSVEKRILKKLHKEYGNPINKEDYRKSFSQWDVAAWLIETLDLPYEQAYTLTKTYFWNYNKLFKEVSKLKKEVPLSYLFFEHIRALSEPLVKKYADSVYGNITIDIDRDSGFEDNRTIRLWSGFRGFTLYIPMGVRYVDDDYGTFISSSNASDRQILVKGNFYPMDKEGIIVDRYISDEEWENVIDENKFMVAVNTEFGEDDNKVVEELMMFEVPYPKPLTRENFNKTFLSVVDDVIEKISKTTFKLPDNVGSINVNSYPIN